VNANKACELRDFRDPELRHWIREIFGHEVRRFGPSFPEGFEYRKHWEIGMSAMAFARAGILDTPAEVLGVGAGSEPTLFWLTSRVRRVFATDLYLAPGEWEQSAATSMLVSPEGHWPFGWNPRRLVVQHMDARELRYETASFDAIFSSSSIEHFGTREDVASAVSEMHRVLRPGGILSLSTELRLRGERSGLPGILMFSPEDLVELVVDNGAWEVLGELDLSVDGETMRSVQDFADAAADVRRHVAEEGTIAFHRLEWSRYPHVVLREDDLWWTSVHLALRRR
jgi:SAM-dependent methyltransferase